MKLLITGASGFLGQRVVASALAAGHTIRAVVRPTTSVTHLEWPDDIEIFRADLCGGTDLVPAFDDVDCLIHLAAGMAGTDEQRFQASVVATERLLEAMSQSNTRQIVLASSFWVYDWARLRSPLNESAAILDPPFSRDGYSEAKIWQERVTRKVCEANSWSLTVLRPGFIWGKTADFPPRVGLQIGRHIAAVAPFADTALTHVDNCADYFVRAAERPTTSMQEFNVIDGHRIRNWKFARTYRKHQPRRGVVVPVPYTLGRLATLTAKLVSTVLYGASGKLPSLLAPKPFQARFRPMRFDNAALFQHLGKPTHSFEQCVEATFSNNALRNLDQTEPRTSSPALLATSAPITSETSRQTAHA